MKSGCCILMVEIENGENLRKFSMERIQIRCSNQFQEPRSTIVIPPLRLLMIQC